MKNIILVLLVILFLPGCVTGSSHLQAVRIDKQETTIGLSNQDPAASFHTAK